MSVVSATTRIGVKRVHLSAIMITGALIVLVGTTVSIIARRDSTSIINLHHMGLLPVQSLLIRRTE